MASQINTFRTILDEITFGVGWIVGCLDGSSMLGSIVGTTDGGFAGVVVGTMLGPVVGSPKEDKGIPRCSKSDPFYKFSCL